MTSIELTYSVPWPISIVLNAEGMAAYNKIFRLLLQIKRSLWALGRIHSKELIAKLRQHEEEEDEEEDPEVSPALRLHRVLLLRSWLLHFAGSVHAHVMSRVLHPEGDALAREVAGMAEEEDDDLDLDRVIKTYKKHLEMVADRCFLHPSAARLREAVDAALAVCLRLADSVSAGEDEEEDACGLPSAAALARMEESYSRSHQFLSSVLTATTRARSVPHLEGLAAALAHSCPDSN